MTPAERRALRRQSLQACHELIQAWKTMPMREAIEAVYGDAWTEMRLIAKTKGEYAGTDVHVLTPLPNKAAG